MARIFRSNSFFQVWHRDVLLSLRTRGDMMTKIQGCIYPLQPGTSLALPFGSSQPAASPLRG